MGLTVFYEVSDWPLIWAAMQKSAVYAAQSNYCWAAVAKYRLKGKGK
jgi:hypothetical protein